MGFSVSDVLTAGGSHMTVPVCSIGEVYFTPPPPNAVDRLALATKHKTLAHLLYWPATEKGRRKLLQWVLTHCRSCTIACHVPGKRLRTSSRHHHRYNKTYLTTMKKLSMTSKRCIVHPQCLPRPNSVRSKRVFGL